MFVGKFDFIYWIFNRGVTTFYDKDKKYLRYIEALISLYLISQSCAVTCYTILCRGRDLNTKLVIKNNRFLRLI